MKPTKSLLVLLAVAAIVAGAFWLRATQDPSRTSEDGEIRAGAPTFVELGSDSCKSCRAMIPVLEELRSAHGCNLNVRFVDVWEEPEEGERFGVKTIPTQVLLDPSGEEITRHSGFWSADAIRASFASNGFELETDKEACSDD